MIDVHMAAAAAYNSLVVVHVLYVASSNDDVGLKCLFQTHNMMYHNFEYHAFDYKKVKIEVGSHKQQ